MKEPRLTIDLIQALCTRLKAGAFPRVAAESLGVPWCICQEWLQRAGRPRAGRLYRQLADDVMQARAMARLRAEMDLREKDVKTWLLQGPGRDSETQEGWGSSPKTAPISGDSAQLFAACAELLKALAPFPEARTAAAEVLAHLPSLEQSP